MDLSLLHGWADLVYFSYGLAFVLLAAVCGAIHNEARQPLPWLWLGLFGIAHGINEWLEMFVLGLGDHPVFAWARLAVLSLSFLCLLGFGQRGLNGLGLRLPWRIIYPVLGLLGAAGSVSGLAGLNVSVRYALGLSGALAAVWALGFAARKVSGAAARPLRWAALAMACYALSVGAGFNPAEAVWQIPVWRGVCMLAVTAGVWFFYLRSGALREEEGEHRPVIGFGLRLAAVSAVLMGAAFVLTEFFGYAAEKQVRRELTIQAETVAAAINPDRVNAVREEAPGGRGQDARRLANQLARIDIADPKLKRLVLLFPDASPALRSIPSDAGDAGSPGGGLPPYFQQAAQLASLFATGRSLLIGPYGEAGKETLTVFAAVRDPDTRAVIAALGLDIDGTVRRERLAAFRMVAIAIALLIAFGLLGFEVSRQRLWLSSRLARTERRRLAEAQRLVHVGSWVYDPEMDCMTWSEEMCRIFGQEPDGERLRRFEEFVAAFVREDHKTIEASLRKEFEGAVGMELGLRVRRPDGLRHVVFKVEVVKRGRGIRPILQGTLQDVTARWETEQALRQSEEKLRLHVERLSLAVIEWDLDFRVIHWNPAAEKIFGYPADQVIGRSGHMLIPEDARTHFGAVWKEVAEGRGNQCINENLTAGGRRILCEWYNTPLTTTDGTVIGVASLAEDITQRQAVEAELRLAATAFETDEAIMITGSNGAILRVNEAFSRITGYRQEEVIGRNPRMFKSGLHSADFYFEIWRSLEQAGRWQGELWNRRKNGEVYPERKTITAVRSEDGQLTHYVAISSDITELKRSEERIRQLAYYDPLTGLPNRSLFVERLARQMEWAQRGEVYGALLFMDLDYFKTLNDSLGHPMGDRLLVQVADRLKNAVDDEEAAARLGGDEFVILLAPAKPSASVAAGQAIVVARRVRELLSAPFHLDEYTHYVSVSIGIAVFPDGAESADDVLKQADTAMYVAKNEGRDGIRFYESSMEAVVRGRLEMEKALRDALTNDEFEVYYQPQLHSDGRVVGAEALIRWFHPERGAISPDQFIPICEQNGMILRVGALVLRRACFCLAELNALGLALPKLSVNVSPRQFMRSDFMSQLEGFCVEAGVSPDGLCLELTEGVLLHHTNLAVAQIERLKNLGVAFSIDDFGTGYSSLAYLKHLPLDDLKIASAFVHDLADGGSDAAIIETIVSMARHLGLGVIAEGVETKVQADILQRYGCHRFQGNYFSRPLPKDEFIRFVAERQPSG